MFAANLTTQTSVSVAIWVGGPRPIGQPSQTIYQRHKPTTCHTIAPTLVAMSRSLTGWLFVAAQVVLLALLVLLPGRSDWATPTWLVIISWLLSVLGFVLVLVAAGKLGSGLTPTPVPAERGQLTETGLYGMVRHPIYTGVLTIVAGIVLRSGSIVHAVLGVATVFFFIAKSSWEEAQLREAYPGYSDYAARTPRFLPKI